MESQSRGRRPGSRRPASSPGMQSCASRKEGRVPRFLHQKGRDSVTAQAAQSSAWLGPTTGFLGTAHTAAIGSCFAGARDSFRSCGDEAFGAVLELGRHKSMSCRSSYPRRRMICALANGTGVGSIATRRALRSLTTNDGEATAKSYITPVSSAHYRLFVEGDFAACASYNGCGSSWRLSESLTGSFRPGIELLPPDFLSLVLTHLLVLVVLLLFGCVLASGRCLPR